jgi:Family of unknown function (DUF6464)
MIGNTDCRFNALSSKIRCGVNPDGPCEGCISFEPLTSDEKEQQALEKPTAKLWRLLLTVLFVISTLFVVHVLTRKIVFSISQISIVHHPNTIWDFLALSIVAIIQFILGWMFLLLFSKRIEGRPECWGGMPFPLLIRSRDCFFNTVFLAISASFFQDSFLGILRLFF